MSRVSDACICTVCGKKFKSTAAFDMHRVGPFEVDEHGVPIAEFSPEGGVRWKKRTRSGRRCMSTEEMIEAGMGTNAKGQWMKTCKTSAFWRKGNAS